MKVTGDIYDPLPLYRDSLRALFRENAEAFFAELAARSGVDEQANATAVAEINALESDLARARSAKAFWGWAVGILIAALAVSAITLVGRIGEGALEIPVSLGSLAAVAAVSASALFGLALPKRRKCSAIVKEKEETLEGKKAEAWEQMAPLNALFDWGDAARIIEKTVPRIAFDPFFTQGRLDELRSLFNWDDAFNENKSVLGAQSGEINGNPFVFGRLLQMNWGEKTYSGSRTVSWTALEHGSDGKLRTVRRYQTLTASVTKPCPEYSQDVLLIYGNDAAPNLSFSREPSELSSAGDGFFARRKLNREIKSLEKFSRNLDDDYGYMIMGNREFEARFQTRDRSDEVEYRLLFTPLAQKQMLELIKDDFVGYGDDFSFLKRRKINVVRADHLSATDLDSDPAKFAGYDFKSVKAGFLGFCETFFKSTYFALAPILSIPLYQQTRTHADIYKGVAGRAASFWEHESLANFLGEERFRHPDSETRNILKTSVANRDGNVATVAVTAHGFRIERRTDIVRVCAGNGRLYDVPVDWDEYLPVSRTSEIRAAEKDGMTKPEFDRAVTGDESLRRFFCDWGADAAAAKFRRSIMSF